MINFFKQTKHPKKRYIYAVTKGRYLGELLVYVDTQEKQHEFLSLPKMCNREIPTEKFEIGLKNDIVDVVTKIPRYVFDVCQKQYLKNKTCAIASNLTN